MQWKTLLVPHDFSPAATRALAVALELAATCGGQVILLHVSPIPHGLRPQSQIIPDGGGEPIRIDEYMTRAARKRLESALDERAATGAIHAVAAENDPAETILAMARELHADALVMGTHGRSGVRRLLVGSVAERVLRRADVPVVVVRDPDDGTEARLREEDAVRDEELG